MVTAEREQMNADLLVVGGGPAGLMAAIRAAELGLDVMVADKGNTVCSGSAAAGNDHFRCYIPEAHGRDTRPILKAFLAHTVGSGRADFAQTWLERSFEVVELWESWGIPMKYKGKWDFAGHAIPGRPRLSLKYSGKNQKTVLTEQALKRGARMMKRVTVFDLLKEGDRVIGALGYDTWNDRVIEFQAKAVFLGTGAASRLYPSSTPGWLFNVPICPVVTGDGRAMVYRAGGELWDMELTGQWAGPKYFSRSGKATWIGVLRDSDDKPIGPFITKPDIVYGDITSDIWPSVFHDYMVSGKGPIFNDCRGASDEELEYMIHWLLNEGNKGLLDHMAEEGIDLRKHAVEFRTYEIGVRGGVRFNVNAETSLEGLYAAGDECGGGIAFASIWGRVAGERAAEFAKKADQGDPSNEKDRIDEKLALIEDIRSRKDGPTWQEANIALQQIMWEYAGLIRSESLLDQGLRNLGRLKERVSRSIKARNGHELGRCLEVMNLLDVGEVVMFAAGIRKETRGAHRRTDYPFTNPMMDKALVIRKEGEKPLFCWMEKSE